MAFTKGEMGRALKAQLNPEPLEVKAFEDQRTQLRGKIESLSVFLTGLKESGAHRLKTRLLNLTFKLENARPKNIHKIINDLANVEVEAVALKAQSRKKI